MHIDIITLFPELLKSPFEASILNRAIKAKKVIINFHNPREYAQNNQKQVPQMERSSTNVFPTTYLPKKI